MNTVFDWVQVSVLSWQLHFAKQFFYSLAHQGVNASMLGTKYFKDMDQTSSVSFPGPIIKTDIDEYFWYLDDRA